MQCKCISVNMVSLRFPLMTNPFTLHVNPLVQDWFTAPFDTATPSENKICICCFSVISNYTMPQYLVLWRIKSSLFFSCFFFACLIFFKESSEEEVFFYDILLYEEDYITRPKSTGNKTITDKSFFL